MDFIRKINLFEGCSWFKFNNLGLAPGIALKYYTMWKKSKNVNSEMFWGSIPVFVEVTGEKLVNGGERRDFLASPHPE